MSQVMEPLTKRPANAQAATSSFWETRFAPFCEKYFLLLCICLIGIACVRVISTYDALSLTPDEPTHFACGLQFVANHVYRLETQHPPLSRAMQALGPYLAGARPAGLISPHNEGLNAMANAGHIDRTIFLMRLGNLPFFLLACCVVCLWGRTFGAPVGVLALALFTLLPTMLADAGLATTDMAVGAGVGASFLAAILWAEKPTVWRSVVLGLCTAVACLSKFTALGYIPVAGALGLACYLAVCWPGWRGLWVLAKPRIVPFALAVSVTAFFIWAGYLFSVGPGRLHGDAYGRLPAPEFFDGIREALTHNRDGHGAFILGQFGWQGWWYYFPVVLAFKTPIAFMILLALGTFVCLKKRASPSYLLPVAFSLGVLLPAMNGRVDIGVRHVEPIYLGFAVVAALGLKQLLQSSRARAASAVTAVALVVWLAISVGIHHPDYLAYVNGFAGKQPENILVDSNYDWGQDLRILSKRLRVLGVQEASMSDLNGIDRWELLQSWYGLPPMKEVNPCVPAPGWNIVGTTVEKSLSWWEESKRYYRGPHTPWYELIPPEERVGPLLIFNIPADSKLTCQ